MEYAGGQWTPRIDFTRGACEESHRNFALHRALTSTARCPVHGLDGGQKPHRASAIPLDWIQMTPEMSLQ